ncbi:MAG TPA: gluconate 2-dehydrogenase subunit 3 family protein [Gemmatimonadaceae bacterium]|nr:gluconate 2-dehydrogenase subunit 3 family protein [Gemmatimonadaceae bacterium]
MSEHDAGLPMADGPTEAAGAPPIPLAAEPADVSRRDLVKLLGMAPLAGALDWSQVTVERAARMVRALQPVDGEQPAAYKPKFFTPREWRTVRVLADYVIPRDERSGSATDAKAPEWMDFMLSEPETSDNSRLAMRGGLAWLDVECRRRFAQPFVGASDAQRRQVLDDIAWPDRARPEMSYGVAFFNRFRDLTAAAFFSSQMGWQDLQYMGHTFVPEWQGCPPAALQKLGVSYDLMNTRVGIQR